MNYMKIARMSLFAMAFLLIATAVLVAFSPNSKSQKKAKGVRSYQAHKVTAPPQVVSKVRGLEISGVSLKDQGTPQATLIIEVTNHRNEAVMALDFVSAKDSISGGIAIDGLLQPDNPRMIIPPHSLETFEWALAEILEDSSLSLASAIFSDGKEEGDKRSLDGMKKDRAGYQKRKQSEERKREQP